MSEEVIELSVDETNALRAKLGLAPLRVGNGDQVCNSLRIDSGKQQVSDAAGDEEVLEMSVDDTNALRAKLGLAPLREDGDNQSKIVHKPAENQREIQEAEERVQRAKLQRDVDRGIANVFGSSTLADGDTSIKEGSVALSWADKMRAPKDQQASLKRADNEKGTATKRKKKKKKDSSRTKKRKSLPYPLITMMKKIWWE